MNGPRVVAISMDAAIPALALSWGKEARLPTLHRLMREGGTALLRSIGGTFDAAVWPSIHTGCLPGKHGQYSWHTRPPGTDAMLFSSGRTYRQPFWKLLRDERVCRRRPSILLVDTPSTSPFSDDGLTQLIGWGERSPTFQGSWPPELYDEVVTRYGRYPRWVDDDRLSRSMLKERRQLRTLERLARVRTRLLRDILRERPWDFCLASYSETHYGGHAFHRYLRPGTWGYDERRAARLGDSLAEIYRAVDRGIGELLDLISDDTNVVVFSGQGFRPAPSGRQLLPQVLTALGYQVRRAASRTPRALTTVRAAVPRSVRRRLDARVSLETRERLMTRAWVEATDWSRTRAVAEPEFGRGWVRINLRGREPRGIVEPGAEYDSLCEEIAGELRALTDAQTGAPAISEVVRRDSFIDGPNAEDLPDLLVRWSSDGILRSVRHPQLGVFSDDLTDAHATVHDDEAFLVAAGPDIRAGATVEGGHIVDIAPTLLYLMDAAIPDDLDGDVLTEIIEPSTLAIRPVRREPIENEDNPWADRQLAASTG
jgi:predicted AlkP superfamily phosphohydrolase/phosphomutase